MRDAKAIGGCLHDATGGGTVARRRRFRRFRRGRCRREVATAPKGEPMRAAAAMAAAAVASRA